ncbi:23S rRNA (guanosine(2251)-2'-O)-methyltransferase RlmB [Candidatus Bathyarchaeota archaeon]|nr:23S rRNA (guanosine(2251)-2'-O)-methyltransferase RlmB [Candidatus Bathyarchaeota archaeon]
MIQLEGRNPVYEAVKQDLIRSIRLEFGHGNDPKIKQIKDLARKKGVKIDMVTRKQIEHLSTTGMHQGVIGYAQTDVNWSLSKVLKETGREVCIMVLDQVQDPHNLGAIIRTSEGAGADGIIIPKKGAASVTNTVHRVSMGASLSVPVWQTNIYPAIKQMQEEGLRIIAVDPSGEKPYYNEKLSGAVALIMGGEDKGISPTLLGKCDSIVNIPMKGKIDSLNVSVATGVVLYERVRQQKGKK